MARTDDKGICHICGKQGVMSFEHIPPRSVGNSHRSRAYSVAEVAEKSGRLDITSVDGVRYQQQQRGSGFSTICRDCNSYLGINYVNEFKDFFLATAQVVESVPASAGAKGIHLETDKANVLALFKHVVSNFCVTTQPGTMLDCKEFLLNKESNAFPRHYQLYTYAVPNPESKMITTGWSRLFSSVDLRSLYTVAYVAMFPLGFALLDTRESTHIPESIGCDITAMAERPWGERPNFSIDLPYMSIDAAFPAPL